MKRVVREGEIIDRITRFATRNVAENQFVSDFVEQLQQYIKQEKYETQRLWSRGQLAKDSDHLPVIVMAKQQAQPQPTQAQPQQQAPAQPQPQPQQQAQQQTPAQPQSQQQSPADAYQARQTAAAKSARAEMGEPDYDARRAQQQPQSQSFVDKRAAAAKSARAEMGEPDYDARRAQQQQGQAEPKTGTITDFGTVGAARAARRNQNNKKPPAVSEANSKYAALNKIFESILLHEAVIQTWSHGNYETVYKSIMTFCQEFFRGIYRNDEDLRVYVNELAQDYWNNLGKPTGEFKKDAKSLAKKMWQIAKYRSSQKSTSASSSKTQQQQQLPNYKGIAYAGNISLVPLTYANGKSAVVKIQANGGNLPVCVQQAGQQQLVFVYLDNRWQNLYKLDKNVAVTDPAAAGLKIKDSDYEDNRKNLDDTFTREDLDKAPDIADALELEKIINAQFAVTESKFDRMNHIFEEILARRK